MLRSPLSRRRLRPRNCDRGLDGGPSGGSHGKACVRVAEALLVEAERVLEAAAEAVKDVAVAADPEIVVEVLAHVEAAFEAAVAPPRPAKEALTN